MGVCLLELLMFARTTVHRGTRVHEGAGVQAPVAAVASIS